MNKFAKVLVCLMAAMLVMSFGACSKKVEDDVKAGAEDVKADIATEFGVLVDEAKAAISTIVAEAEKIEHDAAGDVKTAADAALAQLDKAKSALVSEEQAAKDAAKEELAKAEEEFGKLKGKVEELGDDASEELKKAVTVVEGGLASLKAKL